MDVNIAMQDVRILSSLDGFRGEEKTSTLVSS